MNVYKPRKGARPHGPPNVMFFNHNPSYKRPEPREEGENREKEKRDNNKQEKTDERRTRER